MSGIFDVAIFDSAIFDTGEAVVQAAVVARPGGNGKKTRARYWWESEERKELRMPFKHPVMPTPPQPFNESALRAEAEEEVKAAYKRRRKKLMMLAALLDE